MVNRCADAPAGVLSSRSSQAVSVAPHSFLVSRRTAQAAERRRPGASRLSMKANVQAARETAYKTREAHTLVTADSTVRELGRIAHCDIRKFYNEHGPIDGTCPGIDDGVDDDT
jgi:hypothetical protein